MNVFLRQGSGNQMYPRRISPYPNPAMHMNQKRSGVYSGPGPGPGPGPMQSGFGPNNPNQVCSVLRIHTNLFAVFCLTASISIFFSVFPRIRKY